MSNALALYRMGQYARLSRYGSRAPVLGRAMYKIYRHRAAIARMRSAVRTGKRFYRPVSRIAKAAYNSRARKRARFSPSNIGKPVGSESTKSVIQRNTTITIGTRALHVVALTDIPQGDDINERQRRSANLRGVKFCIEMRNSSERPLYVNMAVVHHKGELDVTTVHERFFHGSGVNRGLNFDDSRSSNELHCLPLNTDKFVVLAHKRFRLAGPKESFVQDYNDQQGRNYMNVDWYTNIKRNVQFTEAAGSSVTPGSNVYMIYWCDQFLTDSGTSSVASALVLNKRIITYFKDPKN